MLVADEQRDKISFDANGLRGGYSLGATSEQGDQATTVVTTTNADGGSQTLKMVCRREAGGWRVSVNDTMRATLGIDMRQMQQGMQQSMQQAAEKMHAEMQDQLKANVQQMEQAIQKAQHKAAQPGK